MYPEELMNAARDSVRGKNPSQAVLKRGISTGYYAMLHTASRDGADLFIGALESSLDEDVWNLVYRAFDHRRIRSVCKNETVMRQFPPEIREFAQVFVEMQEKRIAADYDPSSYFAEIDVLADIENVEKVIRAFHTAPTKHRRAFAALILFKTRTL